MILAMRGETPTGFPKTWTIAGYLILVLAALLVGRIIYEETLYDVNYEDSGGTTPLSGSSVGGHEEMVRFLIGKGADVNHKSHLAGESPVMAAAEMGQLGTVKVLLDNGADPCATDKEGQTAEGLARKYHHPDTVEYLSSRFHCKETLGTVPCVDSALSACVR